MKRTGLLLVITGFGLLPARARAGEGGKQPLFGSAPRFVGTTLVDGALGYGPRAYLASASLWRLWRVEWFKTAGCDAGSRDRSHDPSRFSFGTGLRLTQVGHPGRNAFAGRGPANGQTLEVRGGHLTALNVALQARWRLWHVGGYAHPLHLGFNIDLAGFSVGPACPIASPTADAMRPARPVAGNLLLGNKKDRGTLNSEFYLAYKVTRRVGLRAGLAHVATGYSFDGARYQRFSNVPFVAVSYSPGRRWRDE